MVTQSVLQPPEEEESQAYQSYSPPKAYQPLRTQDVLGNRRRQVAAARNLQDSNVAQGILQTADRPSPVSIGTDLEPEIDESLATRIIKQKKAARGRVGWTGLPVISQVLDAAEWYDTNIQKHLDSLALGAVGVGLNPAGTAFSIGQSVLGVNSQSDPKRTDLSTVDSLSTLGARYFANLFSNIAEIFQVNDSEYDGPLREFLEILPETYDETSTPKYVKGIIELVNPADPLGYVTFKVGGKALKWASKGVKQHTRGLYNLRTNQVKVAEEAIEQDKKTYTRIPDIRVIATGHEHEVAEEIANKIDAGEWFPVADDVSNGPVTQFFQRWWPALDIVNPLAKTNPKALLRHRAGRAVMELNWDLQNAKSSTHTLTELLRGRPVFRDDVEDTLLLGEDGLSKFNKTVGPAKVGVLDSALNHEFVFAIDKSNLVANLAPDSPLMKLARQTRKNKDGNVVGNNANMLNMQFLFEYYKRSKRTDGKPFEADEAARAKAVDASLNNTQKESFNVLLDVYEEIRGFLKENGFSEKILHFYDASEYRARSVADTPEMRLRDSERELRMMQADALGYYDDEMFEPRLVRDILEAMDNGVVYEDPFTTAVQRWEAALRAVAWKKFMTRMGNIADRNVAAQMQHEIAMVQMFDTITDAIGSIAPVKNRAGTIIRASDRFYEAVSKGDDELLGKVIEETGEMFRKLDDDLNKTEHAGESVREQISVALSTLGKIAKMDIETNKHLLIADNVSNLLSRGDTLSILTDDTAKLLTQIGTPEMKHVLRQLKRIGGYRNKVATLQAEIQDLEGRIADVKSRRGMRPGRREERLLRYHGELEKKRRILDRVQRQFGEREAPPEVPNANRAFSNESDTSWRDNILETFPDSVTPGRFPKKLDDAIQLARNRVARNKSNPEAQELLDALLRHKSNIAKRSQRQAGDGTPSSPVGANPKTRRRVFTSDYSDEQVIKYREQFVQLFAEATDLRRFPKTLDQALKYSKGKKDANSREMRDIILERKGVSAAHRRDVANLDKMRARVKDMEDNADRIVLRAALRQVPSELKIGSIEHKAAVARASQRVRAQHQKKVGDAKREIIEQELAFRRKIEDDTPLETAVQRDNWATADGIDMFDEEFLRGFTPELFAPEEALLKGIGDVLTSIRDRLGRYGGVRSAAKKDPKLNPNVKDPTSDIHGYGPDGEGVFTSQVKSSLGNFKQYRSPAPIRSVDRFLLATRLNIISAWDSNSHRPITSKGRAINKMMVNTHDAVSHFRDLRRPHAHQRNEFRELMNQDTIDDPQLGKLRRIDLRLLQDSRVKEFFRGIYLKDGAARELEQRIGQDPGWITQIIKGAATTSATLKTIKSSVDFGTPGIHGLLTATYRPDLFKEGVRESFKAVLDEAEVAKFQVVHRDTIDRLTKGGYDFGSARDQHIPGLTNESDEYLGGKGILGAIGDKAYQLADRAETGSGTADRWSRIGNTARNLEGAVNAGLGFTERQFNHLRTTMAVLVAEGLEDTWTKSAGGDIQGLSAWLNRLTGNYNPERAGFTKRQIAMERAFGFFAPRFLRSTLAVVADAFRGGIKGEQARIALTNQFFFIPLYYMGIATALRQEPKLDPRPVSEGGDGSQFLSVEIAGQNVGLGSTWTAMYRTLGAIYANATSDQDFFDNFDPRAGRDNPFMNFIMSRNAPTSQLLRDLLTGQTYLGEPLETPVDYANWAGSQLTPFWVESAFLGDGGNATGIDGGTILAGAVEVFGARTYPITARERLVDVRDKAAAEMFGQGQGIRPPKYDDLNRLQKSQVNNSPRYNIEEIRQELGDRYNSDEFESVSSIYWDSYNSIREARARALNQGQNQVGVTKDTKWFREHVGEINNFAYAQGELLRSDVFDIVHESFLESIAHDTRIQPAEDVAYDEYMTTIYLNRNLHNDDGSYDFAQRKYLEDKFLRRWGAEVFEYVQQVLEARIATPDDGYPDLLKEMVRGRQMYNFYWDDTQTAVIKASQNPVQLQEMLNEYYAATETDRAWMEENFPQLNEARNQISRIRRKLREKDRNLDIYLYRFYTQELAHPDNQWDGARQYYRSQRYIEFPYPQFTTVRTN